MMKRNGVTSCFGRFLFLNLSICCFLFGSSRTVGAQGVDDRTGPFQLDGDATTDPSICFQLTPGGALTAAPSNSSCPSGYTLVTFGANTIDWQSALVYGNNTPPASVLAQSLVTDATSGNDDAFFGGGSKDTNGISSGPWLWQSTSNPGKADIAHAYAAALKGANSHTFIYFGMDRFDNSGDTTAGFWFLQDSTIALPTTKKGGGMVVSGHHTNGDLLIVADYATGGASPSIATYTWNCSGTGSSCDTSGTLQNVTTSTNQCDPATGTSPLCAITNGTAGLTAPWGFKEKHGLTTFQAGEFMEGGVDLETVFSGNIPCFTTFMAETRSSTSPTSSLQDLTPPVSFPLCGLKVTKTCDGAGTVSADGTSVQYSWTVTATNTGIGNLYDVTIADTLPDGTVKSIPLISESTSPNFLAAKGSASATVTFTATGKNALSVTNTADVYGFTGAGSTGSKIVPSPDVPQTASCQASAPGAITVTKHCDATNGGPVLEKNADGFVVVRVPFTAQICNSSAAGTGEAVNGIGLSDSPAANTLNPSTITTLAPGQCTTVKGDYYPSDVDPVGTGLTPGLIAGRYFFTDTLTATGVGALKGDTVSNSGGVSCPICPSGECDGTLP